MIFTRLCAAALVLGWTGVSLAAPGQVVRSFSAPVAPPNHATYAAGIAHDGTNLYLANLETAYDANSPYSIFVVDPLNGNMNRRINHGLVYQKLTWDGEALWALKMYRQAHRINPMTGELRYAIPLSDDSRGIAWDPGCGHLWDLEANIRPDNMPDVESHRILLRKPDDGAAVHTVTTVAGHDDWWGLAYDGCSLWTIAGRERALVRIDVKTGAEIERLLLPSSDGDGGLAFDGTYLYQSSPADDKVYVIEIGPATYADSTTCTPTATPPSCLIPGITPSRPPIDNIPTGDAGDFQGMFSSSDAGADGGNLHGGSGAAMGEGGCACTVSGREDATGIFALLFVALGAVAALRRRK